jgi:hypothetical protein
MTFRPRIWFPIAAVLSVIDLVAVWPAAAAGEALHASTHAVLALAFGIWALRLRLGAGGRGLEEELDQLELEANDLRQALAEAQERADFAERVLAQGVEQERPDGGR